MNNFKVAMENIFEEEIVDTAPILRQRQTELLKIVEAIGEVAKTDQWKVLKELIFDGVVEALEKRMKVESTKAELNSPEIYRLNGQLAWAKRYSDLNKLVEAYKIELNNITKKLNENATN